ncbi:hypothetical protein CPB84DRAFT_1781008 [Gymnopilus junonius]|uniref:Uncharacterized protein n=1 Tax=Gymnopilus junonius TaxID=109634 RepID=A0A9P5TN38_GYMJU|nr:hypothetical protein CPB84DRAFT_1781008 [Gymnopilus junonius]
MAKLFTIVCVVIVLTSCTTFAQLAFILGYLVFDAVFPRVKMTRVTHSAGQPRDTHGPTWLFRSPTMSSRGGDRQVDCYRSFTFYPTPTGIFKNSHMRMANVRVF